MGLKVSSDLIATEEDPVTSRETSLSVYFLSVTLQYRYSASSRGDANTIDTTRARVNDKVSANIPLVIQYPRFNVYTGWPRTITHALSALDTISDLKSTFPCGNFVPILITLARETREREKGRERA